VPCELTIESDPRVLEQILRNLLPNASKYTRHGKVLLGCRRAGTLLRIELCGPGIGVPGNEQKAIFDEYCQLENPARERERGLGLAIARRTAAMLGHRITLHSEVGKGSIFAVEVALPRGGAKIPDELAERATDRPRGGKGAAILVVEDDPDLRGVLKTFLEDEGHRAATAPDGPTALTMIAQGEMRPDLILADYNLPNGMNGKQLVLALRDALGCPMPAIILTGDISSAALRDPDLPHSRRLHKPVRLAELTAAIGELLAPGGKGARSLPASGTLPAVVLRTKP